MNKKLLEQWHIDEAKSFQGWDFSYLDKRWSHEELPWDYRTILNKYIKPEHILLDMGTGGGEFLLGLNHPYKNTYVTEAWLPNVKLCKKNLEPLGITVKQVEDSEDYPNTTMLPFEDDTFDIIINRHESYNIVEVKRILKPTGIFITQQVGGENNHNLSMELVGNHMSLYSEVNLANFVSDLENQEFTIIDKNEAFPYIKFFDVGAIVFFAKVIVWEFPGFSVDQCLDNLMGLHKHITEKSCFKSLEHRFIIVAINKKN